MKKLYVLLGVALILAAWMTYGREPITVEEVLIKEQAEAIAPQFPEIKNEPVEVQAVLLDYAEDKVLLLKAEAALLKYPALAREILPLYGDEPEFREILLSYGEDILPPIHYFLHNEVRSIEVMHYAAQKVQRAKEMVAGLWKSKEPAANSSSPQNQVADSATTQDAAPRATNAFLDSSVVPSGSKGEPSEAPTVQTEPSVAPEASDNQADTLTPEQRGWYAVNFIRSEGHDFLGQFVADAQGNANWIQTERFLEAGNGLFASGIRALETRIQTDQAVSTGDVGWAAVDVFAVVGALKVLRLGRAAASAARTARTVEVGARLVRAGRIGLKMAKYAKWPTVIAMGYIAATHPAVLTEALGGIAKVIGLAPGVVQVIGWTLILLPVFYIASWIMRYMVRPTALMLGGGVKALTWLERRMTALLAKRDKEAHITLSAETAPAPATGS